jgi:hypothetical protein
MPDYRLYCLDKFGRIIKRHDYEAAHDTEALTLANEREDRHLKWEVWELGRKIATLPAASVNG